MAQGSREARSESESPSAAELGLVLPTSIPLSFRLFFLWAHWCLYVSENWQFISLQNIQNIFQGFLFLTRNTSGNEKQTFRHGEKLNRSDILFGLSDLFIPTWNKKNTGWNSALQSDTKTYRGKALQCWSPVFLQNSSTMSSMKAWLQLENTNAEFKSWTKQKPVKKPRPPLSPEGTLPALPRQRNWQGLHSFYWQEYELGAGVWIREPQERHW